MRLNTFFNQIVNSLLEGVAIEDDEGRLVFANRALEQLLGYEPGGLLGLHWTELFAGERQEGLAAREGDGSRQCYETKLRDKGGDVLPVQASIQPLFESGRPWGTMTSFVDLGVEHHLQEELQRVERTAQIGQNVSSVAHELNNLVTIILLQIRLLHRTDPSTVQFQERMDALEEQGQRARHTMDNLFASAAPRQPRLEATDVNSLIRRVLAQLAELYQTNGFRMHTRLDADLPTIQADPYQLQQIFVNFVNNAYQAVKADRGAGMLEISTRLTEDEQGRGSRLQIQFADNGPGISPEVMPHIFKPFFTTKRPGQGMGLGLAVCDEIARAHQGRIWVENNVEGGATFVLELPAARPIQPMHEVEPAPAGHFGVSIEAILPRSTPFCLNQGAVLGR